jgi:hypothetical protein
MTHRRKFIKATSAATLGLCLAVSAAGAAPKRSAARKRVAAFANLHHAEFSELVGTTFSVTESSGAVLSLTLEESEDQSGQFGGENFSLLFRGSGRRLLTQGTYEFDHRRLGTFGLFIVPTPGDERNAYYSAVFNRLT